jgi:hypothetical protein
LNWRSRAITLPLRPGHAYRLEPVIEDGDTLLDAETGSFVMFVTDQQVKVSEH